MKYLFGILFSPITFAIGFLWPLITQSVIALDLVTAGSEALILGAAIAIPLGLLAQFRGSWVWIK